MTEREALKLALKAFENIKNDPFKFDLKDDIDNAITAIKEALAQQDSKDKEQAKTDFFVRQLDEALAQPWEKFCDLNCVWTDHHPDCKLAERLPLPAFTTGHCKEKAKEGGCQLHNIQCGFPACDRKES